MILHGGTSPENITRLAQSAAQSLADFRAGREVEPILLIEPGAEAGDEPPARQGTAFLIRTSGSTTGTGKLVELPWEAIIASAEATSDALGGPGTWLASLPVHHVAGLQTVLRSVLVGLEPFPYTVGDPLPEGRTYLSLVPTQLRRALRDPDLTRVLTGVDAILVGGQATPKVLLDEGRAAGLNLVTTYGMTETCGGCVYDGKPIGATSLALEDGRIIIEGPVVALGYAGQEAFDGTFYTNDAGEITDRLTILGRIDDAITTGGLTIMPTLLEDFVAERFSIHGIALGAPDPEWGERLVLVTEHEADTKKIQKHAKKALGPEYAPKDVISVSRLGLDSLPLKDSGKIDRRAIAQLIRRET